MPQSSMVMRLIMVLFLLCGGLGVAVAWLLLPRQAYVQNLRAQQIEVVGPGQSSPGVTISAGPDGQGSVVVWSGRTDQACIVIGVDQHSSGGITLLAPTATGRDSPHVRISATEGISQSTGKVLAWRLSSSAEGATAILADTEGRVFAKLLVNPDGCPELELKDKSGRSALVRPGGN